MPSLVVLVPGDLETRTGGYGYDRRIIAGLRGRGWSVDVRRLDDSFPRPSSAARTHAARLLAAIPDGTTVLVDGLALGALPGDVAREATRLEIVALVHHPLAAETGLDPHVAAELEDSERRALAAVRFVVTTSRATAAALAGYGVESDRIAVVEPGTDPAPLARGSQRTSSALPHALCPESSATSHQPFPIREPSAISHQPLESHQPLAISHQPLELALLCVATLIPRKGHDLLFRALASIPHRNWRLICAGSTERDPATVERLRAQLDADGIDDRVELVGDLDAAALAAQYDRADVFVLPTLHEGYGMAVAEALARGLPVVSTATGGIEELVIGRGGAQPAGLVVPPGNLEAFADALSRVLDDAQLRARLAEGARRVRDRLPTWDGAVVALDHVLNRGRGLTPGSEPMADTGAESRCRIPVPEAGAGSPGRTPGSDPRVRSQCATPFSADWLALREPADHAARSSRLARAIAHVLADIAELRVLDLAAGTGANMRYLSEHLRRAMMADRREQRQSWLLVDRDAALLACVPAPSEPLTCRAETRQVDLATLNEVVKARIFDDRALVTASALLDLVSQDWLRSLADRCHECGASVLFALSYDGRIRCSPDDPEDEAIRELVNRHQRTDKGFGPALGPDAAGYAEQCLANLGYRVQREPSDWVLPPASPDLQRQLIEGWAHAAAEIAPARAVSIDGWRSRRLAQVDANRSHLVVGHQDLAAWLPHRAGRAAPAGRAG
jgi:glycosyltransferase involved in cell wall biosynthesis